MRNKDRNFSKILIGATVVSLTVFSSAVGSYADDSTTTTTESSSIAPLPSPTSSTESSSEGESTEGAENQTNQNNPPETNEEQSTEPPQGKVNKNNKESSESSTNELMSEDQLDSTGEWYVQFDEGMNMFISGLGVLSETLTIPDELTVDGVTYPVIGINEDAFSSFTFSEITFGNSLISVTPATFPSSSGNWYTGPDQSDVWGGSITPGMTIRSSFAGEDWAEDTTEQAMTAPKNLIFTENTVDDYILEWDAPDNVSEDNPIIKYLVNVQPENQNLETSDTNVELSDLLSGDHQFSVTAVTNNGNSPTATIFDSVESYISLTITDPVASTTGTPNFPSADDTPIKYQVTTNDFDSYDVSLEVNNDFSSDIEGNNDKLSSSFINLSNYDSNNQLITDSELVTGKKINLTDKTLSKKVNSYELMFNSNEIPFINSGTYSNTVTLSVDNVVPDVPNNVSTLSSLKAGSDYITVSWAAPSATSEKPIKGYKIFDADTNDPLGIVDSNTTSFTLDNLERLTTKSFKIYSYNSSGMATEPLVTTPVTTAKILQVSTRSQAKSSIESLYWTDIDDVADVSLDDINLDDYDVVVSLSHWWSLVNSATLKAFFNSGGKVFSNGNDTGNGQLPKNMACATSTGTSSGKVIAVEGTGLENLVVSNSASPTDSQCFISNIEEDENTKVFAKWSNLSQDYVAGIYFTNSSDGQWIHYQTQNDYGLELKAIEWLLEN